MYNFHSVYIFIFYQCKLICRHVVIFIAILFTNVYVIMLSTLYI